MNRDSLLKTKINEIIKLLKQLNVKQEDNFEKGDNFEQNLKNIIKSMTGIKDVSIRFLEYGVNIYLNGYSICSIYHNKYFEITKTVFYKYDLYFNKNKNYNRFIEVLLNLKYLDMAKIEDFVQLYYLNPKKLKKIK